MKVVIVDLKLLTNNIYSFFYVIIILVKYMEDKYYELHRLTSMNEEMLRDRECVCIYCKKSFGYNEIIDYIPDSDGLTAVCPFCGMDSVLPKEYNGYVISDDDLDNLNREYFQVVL